MRMGHTVKGRNFTRAIAAMRPERTAFRAVSVLISVSYSNYAPPAGFEPAHTAPEAVALSPELWGLAHIGPSSTFLLAAQEYQERGSPDTIPICPHHPAGAGSLAP